MSMQTVWLILLIIFAGVEGITAGLVSVWFCAGSLVALIATWLGAGLPVQIALFVVVSLVAMALVRPMARKWVQPKLVKTNADRILGQEAVVLEEIDNLRGIGQVKVGGAIWTARSTQDEPHSQGNAGPRGAHRGRESHCEPGRTNGKRRSRYDPMTLFIERNR